MVRYVGTEASDAQLGVVTHGGGGVLQDSLGLGWVRGRGVSIAVRGSGEGTCRQV